MNPEFISKFAELDRETQLSIIETLQSFVKGKPSMSYSEEFLFAVEHVLEIEGIFSDHSADRGGLTKYGITHKTWANFITRSDEWAKKSGTFERLSLVSLDDLPDSVRDIDKDMVIEVYFIDYWTSPGIDRISNKYVAAECFDGAVNSGPHFGVLWVQKALNMLRKSSWGKVAEDGQMGPVTESAIERMVGNGYTMPLVTAQNGFQFIYMSNLVQHDPDRFLNFSRGWMKRISLFGDE